MEESYVAIHQRKENGRMMLESIENGPLVYPTIKENGQIRNNDTQNSLNKNNFKMTMMCKQQTLFFKVSHQMCIPLSTIFSQLKISGIESSYSCKALNCHIKNVNVNCTMSSTSLLQSRMNHFMSITCALFMRMHQVQVNTKFFNALQPEWSKFVIDVKLAKNMYNTNYDQLYAYLSQHEGHANEVRMLRERYPDPLALVANYQTQSNSAHHTPPSVPQNAYHTPPISQQPQVTFPQLDSGLVVSSFLPGDDLIACLNKAMAFMSTMMASYFPLTNNQLRTSSNPRNQATIQYGRVTVQQAQGRHGQSFAGTRTMGNVMSSKGNIDAGQARIVKCYNCQGEGHMERQCTQSKRPRNSMLMTPIVMIKAVLMANLSSYDSDVLSEMSEQMPNHVTNWDKVNQDTKTVNESLTAELERYKERVKNFEQRRNINLSIREKLIDSQMDDMIRKKNALKQEIDSLKQTLSKQEIDLENKIKELDNIVYKVGQSAQAVHMLTELQSFYDATHKQALSNQNPFYHKKAQRIKPTLYDGFVISKKHDVFSVVDEEETLILEEESR
ncbi:integrase, catalytic region, zinc finger, CCHC-type containing protein [Tanacetum coccineum]